MTTETKCVFLTVVPFSGFYETSHDNNFDSDIDSDCENLETVYGATEEQIEKYREAIMDGTDWKKCHETYATKYAEDFFDYIAHELGLTPEQSKDIAVYESLESPKEYNFATDRIFAKVSLDIIQRVWDETRTETLKLLIEDLFTSYDGFSSAYSNELSDWPANIREWDHNQLETLFLAFLIQEHLDGSDKPSFEKAARRVQQFLSWDLMEDRMCNGFIGDILWANVSQKAKDIYDEIHTIYEEKQKQQEMDV